MAVIGIERSVIGQAAQPRFREQERVSSPLEEPLQPCVHRTTDRDGPEVRPLVEATVAPQSFANGAPPAAGGAAPDRGSSQKPVSFGAWAPSPFAMSQPGLGQPHGYPGVPQPRYM